MFFGAQSPRCNTYVIVMFYSLMSFQSIEIEPKTKFAYTKHEPIGVCGQMCVVLLTFISFEVFFRSGPFLSMLLLFADSPHRVSDVTIGSPIQCAIDLTGHFKCINLVWFRTRFNISTSSRTFPTLLFNKRAHSIFVTPLVFHGTILFKCGKFLLMSIDQALLQN